ncbi:hypothetical protein T484DRAFT_1786627 [Baffinella frigidus]|nr:hypothetical protein T484DRAFT_1786627 [Cryptophyta sp. CCMP2293]
MDGRQVYSLAATDPSVACVSLEEPTEACMRMRREVDRARIAQAGCTPSLLALASSESASSDGALTSVAAAASEGAGVAAAAPQATPKGGGALSPQEMQVRFKMSEADLRALALSVAARNLGGSNNAPRSAGGGEAAREGHVPLGGGNATAAGIAAREGHPETARGGGADGRGNATARGGVGEEAEETEEVEFRTVAGASVDFSLIVRRAKVGCKGVGLGMTQEEMEEMLDEMHPEDLVGTKIAAC